MMMLFNFFSHGTQDLYPTFLQKQHQFDPARSAGSTSSPTLARWSAASLRRAFRRIGRVNAITIAALSPCPPCRYGLSSTPFMLAVGAFIMQIAVQGAWGVVPAHLNELSPGAVRATLPAFIYQAGNFLASFNGPFQAKLAEANGGDYSYALALVGGVVAVALIIVSASARRSAARRSRALRGRGEGVCLIRARRLRGRRRHGEAPRPAGVRNSPSPSGRRVQRPRLRASPPPRGA